jgi:hypothetical protein
VATMDHVPLPAWVVGLPFETIPDPAELPPLEPRKRMPFENRWRALIMAALSAVRVDAEPDRRALRADGRASRSTDSAGDSGSRRQRVSRNRALGAQ